MAEALILFIVGIVVGIVAEALVHTIPPFNHAARQVFQFNDVRTMRDVVIPIATQLLPVFIAVSLWLATRGTRPRVGAANQAG